MISRHGSRLQLVQLPQGRATRVIVVGSVSEDDDAHGVHNEKSDRKLKGLSVVIEKVYQGTS